MYGGRSGHSEQLLQTVLTIFQCGGVVTQGVCSECRAPIGGTNYNLQQGNKQTNM